jgi:hypothetical protein
MNHSDTARAIARDTGWQLDEYAQERDWAAVGIGPVGQHRDSDALARSNFEIIAADLRERFGDAADTARFSHWAVGWVEELTHDAGNPAVVAAVAQWREALDGYPVADEMHWSQLEWDENHPSDGQCYSDDPDCCALEA